MRRQHQPVLVRAEADETHAQQRPARQIKRSLHFRRQNLGFPSFALGGFQQREIVKRERHGSKRRNLLAFPVRQNCRPKRLMAADRLHDRRRQRVFVQWSPKRQHHRLVERAGGSRAHLGRHPDPALRLRQRKGQWKGQRVTSLQLRRIRRRQEAAALHLGDAFPKRFFNLFNVAVRVRRGQEAGAAFPDMNAMKAQMEEQQACPFPVRRELEIKQRAEVREADRHADALKVGVDPARKLGRPGIQRVLERRSSGLQMFQRRFGGGQGQRVTDKRPGEKRHARFRPAFIAVLPLSAVKRIQVL